MNRYSPLDVLWFYQREIQNGSSGIGCNDGRVQMYRLNQSFACTDTNLCRLTSVPHLNCLRLATKTFVQSGL